MEDCARAGNRVKEDIVIDEGPLDGFQHTSSKMSRIDGNIEKRYYSSAEIIHHLFD